MENAMKAENVPAIPTVETPAPLTVTEEEIDQALDQCDGDPRATIRALLVGQAFLDRELQLQTSRGYSRRLPLAKLSDVQG